MDPKETRHSDLKGDRGLIYFLNPRDPNYTHYLGYHKGKQVGEKEKAEIIDTFTTSAMQLPSPDPVILSKYKLTVIPVGKNLKRALQINTDTKNIASKMPRTNMLTGMNFTPQQTGQTKFYDTNAFKSTY